jgi:transcriptional regulator with PAS, ATPase and Fis domain
MARLVQRARRVALRNVPVLIEGESGTGKELFAKAIHQASPRRDRPFKSVNCGAIPSTLVESVLFGHEKGAFTGADRLRKGVFEEAHGGTLFLDELGRAAPGRAGEAAPRPPGSKVTRVGSTSDIDVDVRVVSATNRTVIEEVEAGRFREDLFYRLAVAVLKIPPLRERAGDLGLLIDELLKKENQDAEKAEPGYVHKKLSTGARNLLLAHPWPGNVRELQLTLRRAAIWSDAVTISTEDIRESLLAVPHAKRRDVLGRPLGDGLNLPGIPEGSGAALLGARAR